MNTRPTSVTVFGILNIVFGVLGMCGMVFSAVVFMIPPDPNIPNPVLDMVQEGGFYSVFLMVSLFLGSIATIALLAAGVGLLQMKSWGRMISIVYAIYAILSGLVGMVVNYFFLILPLMEQAEAAGPGPAQAGAVSGAISGGVGGCIGLIYPVLLLIFMNTAKVKAAFSGDTLEDQQNPGDPQSSFAPPTDPNNPYGSPHTR